MRVSVVIPTYNRAELLQRCLESLYAAEVPELEVVVVDDGGSDDSESVVRTFGARYLRQANSGPATARNLGVKESTGQYVAFIDSDDEWINGGASRLALQLDSNRDIGVIFADTSMGNLDSGFASFVETYSGTAFENLPHILRAGGVRLLARQPFMLQLSTRNVMFLGSTLFRRETFLALGGFDAKLCGAADWDVFMRATAATPVAFSEGPPLSRYYKHETAMSANYEHMHEDFIKALQSVRERSDLDGVERVHIDQRLRAHVSVWANDAFHGGDFESARARLKFASNLAPMGFHERAMLLATYLPPSFIAGVRRTKHALGF